MAMPAHADTLVATRNLRAQSIIAPGDITIVAADVPGALDDPAQAVGQEVRVSLYAGRPLRPGDIGPPTVVDRNQIVALAYSVGPLTIQTEGRALARGGVGDVIRIMNLASRTTVSGRVLPDGSVAVGPNN
ncbi:MAG: flagellar basal body P-ring formation chaperone FlgA [Gemmobacter sp.]|nr:flagellar basal body P-ring formation chaperone FlgA [Gemmobacter sp.]